MIDFPSFFTNYVDFPVSSKIVFMKIEHWEYFLTPCTSFAKFSNRCRKFYIFAFFQFFLSFEFENAWMKNTFYVIFHNSNTNFFTSFWKDNFFWQTKITRKFHDHALFFPHFGKYENEVNIFLSNHFAFNLFWKLRFSHVFDNILTEYRYEKKKLNRVVNL